MKERGVFVVFFAFLLVLGISSTKLTLAECPQGDVNGDCEVNLSDVAIVAAQWLNEGTELPMYPDEAYMQGERAMHLTLEGAEQDAIRGDCIVQGREDTILVIDYSHRVYIPTDPQSGQIEGQKCHVPLTITKYTDAASPLMLEALCDGERMTQFVLHCYWTNAEGHVENYYTITLTDAHIVDYTVEHPNIETFSFIYTAISWENHAAGTSGDDGWNTPG